MKTSRLFLSAATIALMTSVYSCGNGNGSANDTDSIISSMKMTMDIKSASRNFKIKSFDPEFECYLTISADVQWPTSIGTYDISSLQDTLLAIAFPDQKIRDIDSVILDYTADAKAYELGDSITTISNIPDNDNSSISIQANYFNNVKIQLTEINDQLATFNVQTIQYMGGAHPNSGSFPFSYDLTTGNVINYDWLFKEGSEDDILDAIKNEVARQLDIMPDELADIQISEFAIPASVYILNGCIVFHYNHYEVLPYSYGAIDVTLSPIYISSLLTDQAKELFNTDL